MTKGKRQYREFLKTEFWKELSGLKKRLVTMCERCPSRRQLQCHHRVYRDSWYDTRLEDLEVVCRECHEKEHGLRAPEKEEFEIGFWGAQDMCDIRRFTLELGKPMTRSQRKKCRHIAEMLSDNRGILLQFRRLMLFNNGVLLARQSGLRGYAAVNFALEKGIL